MAILAVFCTPIMIATILFPVRVINLFWAGSGGAFIPIEDISPVGLLVVLGEIAAACAASIYSCNKVYIGWKARKDIRMEQDPYNRVLQFSAHVYHLQSSGAMHTR